MSLAPVREGLRAFVLVVFSKVKIADALGEYPVERLSALEKPAMKLRPLFAVLDVSRAILHNTAVTLVREFLPVKGTKLSFDHRPLLLKESKRLLRLAVSNVKLTSDSMAQRVSG